VRLYKDRASHAQLAAKAKEEYQPICWEVMRQRYIKLIEDLAGSALLIPERVHVTVTGKYVGGK